MSVIDFHQALRVARRPDDLTRRELLDVLDRLEAWAQRTRASLGDDPRSIELRREANVLGRIVDDFLVIAVRRM